MEHGAAKMYLAQKVKLSFVLLGRMRGEVRANEVSSPGASLIMCEVIASGAEGEDSLGGCDSIAS